MQGYDGHETVLGELFDENGFWYKDTAPVDWGNPEAELDNEYLWRVFMMRELHGFSTVEISSEFSISENNIWVILHHARLCLRLCLEQNWFGE